MLSNWVIQNILDSVYANAVPLGTALFDAYVEGCYWNCVVLKQLLLWKVEWWCHLHVPFNLPPQFLAWFAQKVDFFVKNNATIFFTQWTSVISAMSTLFCCIFVFRTLQKPFKFYCLFLITSSFSRSYPTCCPTVLYHWSHMAHLGPAKALPQSPFHQAPIQTFPTSPSGQPPSHSLAVWAQRRRPWLWNLLMEKLVLEFSRLPHTPPVPYRQECLRLFRTHSYRELPPHLCRSSMKGVSLVGTLLNIRCCFQCLWWKTFIFEPWSMIVFP